LSKDTSTHFIKLKETLQRQTQKSSGRLLIVGCLYILLIRKNKDDLARTKIYFSMMQRICIIVGHLEVFIKSRSLNGIQGIIVHKLNGTAGLTILHPVQTRTNCLSDTLASEGFSKSKISNLN
jgi:hypothetical protein